MGIPFGFKYDSIELSNNLLDIACALLPDRALCGSGNIISTDPMFVDAPGGDYRLQPCSPAIDAGSDVAALLAGLLEDYDGNPRILDQAVDIGPFESPMIAETQTPNVTPACAGEPEGAVQFALENGCLPLEYTWDNGSQTGDSLAHLAPGAYHFTITDQKGKLFETTVQVPGATLLEATATILDASAPGASDGSIAVTVQTGTAPFSYLWNTADMTAFLNNLLPGNYTLTITDAVGCEYFYAYEVKFTSGTNQSLPGQIKVFPNPASDFLGIEVDQSLLPLRLRLMDAHGRQVLNQVWNGASVPLNDLPSGVYVLHLLHPGLGVFADKILILHK